MRPSLFCSLRIAPLEKDSQTWFRSPGRRKRLYLQAASFILRLRSPAIPLPRVTHQAAG